MNNRFINLCMLEVKLNKDFKVSWGLAKMAELIEAFQPESCSRQVFIFFKPADQKAFIRTLEHLKSKVSSCIYASGFEAYYFLISWIVGAEYREYKPNCRLQLNNDNHVLGRFKTEWKNFQKTNFNPVLAQKLMAVVEPLLRDAHQVRKLVEDGCFAKRSDFRVAMDKLIANITFSRSLGLTPSYLYFTEPTEVYQEKVKISVTVEIKKLEAQRAAQKYANLTLFECPAKLFLLEKMIQLNSIREELEDRKQATLPLAFPQNEDADGFSCGSALGGFRV